MVIQSECGMVCYVSNNKLITMKDFLKKLKLIQHRGQDCYGITIKNNDKDNDNGNDNGNDNDNYEIKYIKNKINFENHKENELKMLNNFWFGHVRYCTSKGDNTFKSQPIKSKWNNKILNYDIEYILAHNGNIPKYVWDNINYDNFTYNNDNTDTENLVNLINIIASYEKIDNNEQSKLIQSQIIFNNTLKKILELLKGSYSLIIYTNKKLIVLRDRYGIRPLIIGKKENELIITSESVSITSTSKDYKLQNVKEGEIINIDINTLNVESVYQYKNSIMKKCIFEYIYFMNEKTNSDNILVSDFRIDLSNKLSKQLMNLIKNKERTLICGIPNTGKLYGMKLSKCLNLKYEQLIEINEDYKGRVFILKNNIERRKACNEKFNINKELLKNVDDLILVDDSIVRGNNMKYICDLVNKNFNGRIHIVSASPPVKYPCYYGVDFADIEELIINKKSKDEIINYFNITSLIYLSLDNLNNDDEYCNACFTGNYLF